MNPEFSKLLKDKRAATLVAITSGLALVACSVPAAAPAPEAKPGSKGNDFNQPHIGSVSKDSPRTNINADKLYINPETGVETEIVAAPAIFTEGSPNNSFYFCKDAPKGQAELNAQFANNKDVRARLLAMGLNPNGARFLSDQPVTISETKDLYIKAGLSEAQAEKLADPKAQMSPYKLGGRVVLAPVTFDGENVVTKENAAQFERSQGKYNPELRKVWPMVFDKVPGPSAMTQIGGASLRGMSLAIYLPAEALAAGADGFESGGSVSAASIDALCCQPLTPGKPITPETPPTQEVPSPTPTATKEIPTRPRPPVETVVITVPPIEAPKLIDVCIGINQYISVAPERALELAKEKGYGGSYDFNNADVQKAIKQHLFNYCQPSPTPSPTGTPTPPTHENHPSQPSQPQPEVPAKPSPTTPPVVPAPPTAAPTNVAPVPTLPPPPAPPTAAPTNVAPVPTIPGAPTLVPTRTPLPTPITPTPIGTPETPEPTKPPTAKPTPAPTAAPTNVAPVPTIPVAPTARPEPTRTPVPQPITPTPLVAPKPVPPAPTAVH